MFLDFNIFNSHVCNSMKHSYELMKVEQQGKLVAVYLIYVFIWLKKSLHWDEIAVWALQLITARQHAVKSSVGTLIKS